MPRISRRTPRAHARLTVTQLYALVSGHDFFCEWHLKGTPMAAAYPAMREAWEALGAELLALHIEHHPGSRPWSWWQFEAPERRQRVDRKPHPCDDGSIPPAHRMLYYGLPSYLQTEDHFEAVYESQAEYLERLDLLTADEEGTIEDPDWGSTGVYEEEQLHLSLEVIRVWYGHEE